MKNENFSEIFNLPTLQDVIKENEENETEQSQDDDKVEKASEMLQDLSTRIALLEGTDHAESMDSMHGEIIQHARDLMAYGFNLDIPRARGIFEIAATMYGHAISTKNSKRDAQLKALRLALDKRKVDLDERKTNHIIGSSDKVASIDSNNVVVEDRNELLKRLREQIKSEK